MKRLVRIRLIGAVQGVGMRPFIARLAARLQVRGWVLNSEHGVFIEAEAEEEVLSRFIQALERQKPRSARIYSKEVSWHDPVGHKGFVIKKSQKSSSPTTLILPDIATCEKCLEEVFDPKNRRYLYPFTNCTDCGPRFSIILSLPYDRPKTTMRVFEMCQDCAREYSDPEDRRFHAQPNACPACGPGVWLTDPQGRTIARDQGALQRASDMIKQGKVLAVKGLGGFHLICDATDPQAVRLLRQRKHRYEKPLAVMFKDMDQLAQHCRFSREEASVLLGPEAPIVLLTKSSGYGLAPQVAPDNPYLGAFLPYTPLHHILMREINRPCVATSGNMSDEPMVIHNQQALERLSGVADGFLLHNRPIQRRVDDSVVFFVNRTVVPVRRARGYAPLPIMVHKPLPRVLALGGHHRNTIAISLQDKVFLSQHIGDLDTGPGISEFKGVIQDMMNLWEFVPQVVAVDMHPDYISTKHGRSLGFPLIEVQHHHAHLASVAAEHRQEGPVLAATWDGTGWGPDGTVWGGEFLFGDYQGFTRVARLRPFKLIGAEAGVKQPIRTGLSLLLESVGSDAFLEHRLPEHTRKAWINMARTGFNSPLTSSGGRLFDGIAGLIGVAPEKTSFDGQAAMALEFAAVPDKREYAFVIEETDELMELDWRPVVQDVIRDISRGTEPGIVSYRFHKAVARAMIEVAKRHGENRLFLSGGCFQNRLLMRLLLELAGGVRLYWHQLVPPNDGGLSLGQVMVAGAKYQRGQHET